MRGPALDRPFLHRPRLHRLQQRHLPPITGQRIKLAIPAVTRQQKYKNDDPSSQYVLNGNLQEAFLSILRVLLLEEDLVVGTAAFLLQGQPLLDQLDLLLAGLRVQLDELALLVVVPEGLAALEVHRAVGPQPFLEEHVAVYAVVGLHEAGVVLVHVLLGRDKGQFRHLQGRLIARSAVTVPDGLLAALH